MILGKEALAGRSAFRRGVVHVPEWGGDIQIRELSAMEKAQAVTVATGMVDAETKSIRDATQLIRFQTLVIVAGWVDEAGANVLTADDATALEEQPAAIIARIADAITELSGLGAGEAPVDAAKNA